MPTGAHFRAREIPGGDPVAWLRSRIAAVPNRFEVSVLIARAAPEVQQFVGQWATVEPVAAGCRLRMNVDDLGWPVMVLGALGADFEVESPPELHDRVRVAGETLLRGAGR
jgi:predicted DNA-binding transcriptional regulator YafY